MTFSAWFNTSWVLGGGEVGTIANNGGSFAGGKRYMINFVEGGRGQLTFDDDVNFRAFNSAGGLNDGQWHHVAIVRDNADVGNEAKLYVDGLLSGSQVYSGGSLDSPAGRRVGAFG